MKEGKSGHFREFPGQKKKLSEGEGKGSDKKQKSRILSVADAGGQDGQKQKQNKPAKESKNTDQKAEEK